MTWWARFRLRSSSYGGQVALPTLRHEAEPHFVVPAAARMGDQRAISDRTKRSKIEGLRSSLAGIAPDQTGSWIAKPFRPLLARRRPGDGARVARVDVTTTYTGSATRLLVTAGRYDREGQLWLQVALPIRPTGVRGWIPAAPTHLYRSNWFIRISTKKRRLEVFESGRLRRSVSVVVGSRKTPTPVGLFAVYEKTPMANPRGFEGPWALHLTAFSNVLFQFGAGKGRVAIHGRGPSALGDPLGSARSNGCIRLHNRDIQWLRSRVGHGTTVRITR